MRLLILIIAVYQCQVTFAQPESITHPSKKLKILSWNIYMLPPLIASHSGKVDRAEAIGQVLDSSDYDVIFLQEAFHPKARKIITDRLSGQYPYNAGPAGKKWFSIKTSSGLQVFSKHPILFQSEITYKTRYGIDALSRKGALMIELDFHGQRIQVVGTHLQNCGPGWLKKIQCAEMNERLLKPFAKNEVPQIVCGDFNIDRKGEEETYLSLLKLLEVVDTNGDTSAITYDRIDNELKNETGSRDIIDYVFVKDNGCGLKWISKVQRLRKKWSKRASDLSDHYSVAAEVEIGVTRRSLASINK